jgi:hypothetical protein
MSKPGQSYSNVGMPFYEGIIAIRGLTKVDEFLREKGIKKY